MDANTSLTPAYISLRLCYGLIPIVAGLDKFTNLLVDWSKYLADFLADGLPMAPETFMMAVGVIEIIAGIVVLTKLTRLGAYIVMVWLLGIAVNLIIAGYLDIAVRDVAMAVGAYALAALAAARGQAILPFGAGGQSAPRAAAG